MFRSIGSKSLYLLVIFIVITGSVLLISKIPTVTINNKFESINYDKKLSVAESIIRDLVGLKINQERLNWMQGEEEKTFQKRGYKLDEEFYSHNKEYLSKRNENRKSLYKDFELANKYFSPSVTNTLKEFKTWDSNSVRYSNHSIYSKEFNIWIDKIIAKLKYEIKPK